MTTPKANPYTYFGMTVSVCPTCHASLPASLMERDGKVYLSRACPTHGRSVALISSDAAWYHEAQRHTSPSVMLRAYQTEVVRSCPQDCGVCPEHQQNNAAPVIEITNICNIDCPICFADNHHDYLMTDEELDRCLATIESSGTQVDVLILTGGEPTAHPRLLDLIDRALARPFIPRVAIATNGILISRKDDLVAGLAARHVDVILQLDSRDPRKNTVLRGEELHGLRERALAMLEKHGVRTTVLMTVIKGLNDDELGDLVEYCLHQPFISGFEAQAMSYTGQGGRQVRFDPMDRITGTDLLHALESQCAGRLSMADFLPMPHPHPNCVAVTYLLVLEDGTALPFPRFADPALYREALAGQFIATPDERHEALLRRMIDEAWVRPVYAEPGGPDKAPLVLRALKGLLTELFPEGRRLEARERNRIVERHVKHVFLHHMMDDHSFDAAVLRKCTSMQVIPDGRMIPHCGYRVLHRSSDPRWADKLVQIGHGIDGLRRKLQARGDAP